jgi:hypothetical protein
MIMVTALAVIVSQHLQRLDALRVAADKPFQKGDFDIQLSGFFPGQQLIVGTRFFRHTTAWIISGREAQVKRRTVAEFSKQEFFVVSKTGNLIWGDW